MQKYAPCGPRLISDKNQLSLYKWLEGFYLWVLVMDILHFTLVLVVSYLKAVMVW